MRDELERTIEMPHNLDNRHTASFKDYWNSIEEEKDMLR